MRDRGATEPRRASESRTMVAGREPEPVSTLKGSEVKAEAPSAAADEEEEGKV